MFEEGKEAGESFGARLRICNEEGGRVTWQQIKR